MSFNGRLYFYAFSRTVLCVFCWVYSYPMLEIFSIWRLTRWLTGQKCLPCEPNSLRFHGRKREPTPKNCSLTFTCVAWQAHMHTLHAQIIKKKLIKKISILNGILFFGREGRDKAHYAVQSDHVILLLQPPQLLGFSEHTTTASSGQHLQVIRSQLCSDPRGASSTPSCSLLTAQNPWFSCS